MNLTGYQTFRHEMPCRSHYWEINLRFSIMSTKSENYILPFIMNCEYLWGSRLDWSKFWNFWINKRENIHHRNFLSNDKLIYNWIKLCCFLFVFGRPSNNLWMSLWNRFYKRTIKTLAFIVDRKLHWICINIYKYKYLDIFRNNELK